MTTVALGVVVIAAIVVLALTAHVHHRALRMARIVHDDEDRLMDEVAVMVDNAYDEWLSEGGQAFTGTLPPRKRTDQDWFPFD